MTELEDISHEVWNRAVELARSIYCEADDSGSAYIPSDEIPAIARAIQEAVMQEREACASLAYVESVKHCAARDGMKLIGDPVGFSVSQAIRNRGGVAKSNGVVLPRHRKILDAIKTGKS